MIDLAAYGGMFLAAFLAATVFPAQSEAALVALLLAGKQNTILLLAVASLGNILGSVVNWFIGLQVDRFRDRPWFPASGKMLERARALYARWGYWSLLASFAPIVGDPLTVIAGIMREPLWRFLLLVSISKIARYLLLAAVTLAWFG